MILVPSRYPYEDGAGAQHGTCNTKLEAVHFASVTGREQVRNSCHHCLIILMHSLREDLVCIRLTSRRLSSMANR